MPYPPPPKPPRRWDEAFTHLYLVPEHTNGLSQRIKGPAGAGPASVPPPRPGFYDILLPPKFLPCRSRTPGSLRPVPLPPLSWFVLDYLLCRVQHVPTCTKSASVPFRASPTQSRPMPHLFQPCPYCGCPCRGCSYRGCCGCGAQYYPQQRPSTCQCRGYPCCGAWQQLCCPCPCRGGPYRGCGARGPAPPPRTWKGRQRLRDAEPVPCLEEACPCRAGK